MQALVITTLVSATLVNMQANAGNYVRDSSGNILENNAGECVRTGYWQPDATVRGCGEVPMVQSKQRYRLPDQPPASGKPVANQLPSFSTAPIRFAFDSAAITRDEALKLDHIANMVGALGYKPRVELIGHTDRIGPSDYNRDLAKRRAESVRDYLKSELGIESNYRLVSKGERKPLVTCDRNSPGELIDCLAPNRRVEIHAAATEDSANWGSRGNTEQSPQTAMSGTR